MDPVVIRNQGAETVWHPRRCDLPAIAQERDKCPPCHGACDQGRSCPAQRYPIRFKTDAEMRSEGWEPVRLPEFLGRFLGGMGAIALTMLALWVIGMAGGLN